VGFDPERLAAIARMEPEHFWFVGRQALMESMVEPLLAEGEPLLDVGCGTGSLVTRWAAGGRRVIGLDQRPEGIAAARARLEGAAASGGEFVVGDALSLPFDAGTFAGAFALDVLEHLDDQRALGELRRVLRPNGWIFVTVPALPLLWSQRDELAGHLRRYTRSSLTHALQGAGLKLEAVRAYQFTLLPLVAISRLLGRRSTSTRDLEDRPAAFLNRALRAINLAEVRSGIHWPLGSSLAALARKPA
jgi:ubiquinone/menaquinone biosynthesis C-methylase UbiE